MIIDTIGTHRFRIINVVKSQPVLIAEVEILPDGTASDKDPWVGGIPCAASMAWPWLPSCQSCNTSCI